MLGPIQKYRRTNMLVVEQLLIVDWFKHDQGIKLILNKSFCSMCKTRSQIRDQVIVSLYEDDPLLHLQIQNRLL